MSPKSRPNSGTTPQAIPLFDPTSFKSLTPTLLFENLTSQTQITQAGQATIQELLAAGVIVELPGGACAAKHRAGLTIELGSILIQITGVVKSLTKNKDGTLRVEIEFVQFEKADWDQLLALYAHRQSEIEDFFKKARGY